MAILRRDDTVANTIGTVVPGANVYYLTQPADVNALTPLATVYSDTSGTTAANPQTTDGFGHAVAYLNNGQLYTVVYEFPNVTKIVYPDQSVGDSSGGSPLTAFGGTPQGTVDGANRTFTLVNGTTPLTAIPTQMTAWLNFPLGPGLGYVTFMDSGIAKITFATAPQPVSGSNPADFIYAQGLL